jgi:nucleoid-associated protein YgaU
MMRKDVKVGLVVGTLLLAVLVAYFLVMSGSPKPREVAQGQRAETPSAESLPVAATTSENPLASASVEPATPSAVEPVSSPGSAKSPVAAVEGTDPFAPGGNAAAAEATDPWAVALSTGKLPVLMSQTPVPGDRPAQPRPEGARVAVEPAPADRHPGHGAEVVPAATVGENSAAVSNPSSEQLRELQTAAPARDAAPAGATRTHVVQAGESFASIAAKYYGRSSEYTRLIKANPHLDPRKLKIGQAVVIPGDDVAARSASDYSGPAGDGVSSPTDPRREYRVVSGDSLHRISQKLYGRSDQADRIYQLNKAQIGADPARLKVGMVLQLPEPPTVGRTAR